MLKGALRITVLLYVCILPFGSNAQTTLLRPGDINDNGIVNSSDVLYWGLAYGVEGPERQNKSTSWNPVRVDSLWAQSFPDGTNYAFADCNGDGIVDDDDLAVIAENFRNTSGMVREDQSALGIPGIDPPLQLIPQANDVEPGGSLQVALDLGSPDQPINDFYGIAMQFSYTSALVADRQNDGTPDDDDDDNGDDDNDDDDNGDDDNDDDDDDDNGDDDDDNGDDDDDDNDDNDDNDDDPGVDDEGEWRSSTSEDSISFELDDNSWVQMMDTETTRSLLITDRNTGEAELVITRIDQQPVTEGEGTIGLFTIVIEDIVVGLEKSDTLEITIDKIRSIDTTLTITAVAPDSTAVTVTPDSLTTSTTSKLKSHDPIELYPNPTTGYTYVLCSEAIESVALFTLAGQPVTVFAERLDNHQYRLQFPNELRGMYILRVAHAAGFTTEKVTIISQ